MLLKFYIESLLISIVWLDEVMNAVGSGPALTAHGLLDLKQIQNQINALWISYIVH
jgi:hypothetical protein